MKLLQFRIPLLLIALLGVQLISIAMLQQYSHVTVQPLSQPLERIPGELNGWAGQTAESDPNLLRAIDADELLNRQYQKEIEWPVSIHCATFNSLEHWCPHSPLECYPAAGWHVKEEVVVRDETAPQRTMHWVEFGKATGTVQVLYWFQRGEDVYYDREGARQSRQNIWGQQSCSPLVKVVLQTDGRAGSKGKENMLRFADSIRQWIATQGSSLATPRADVMTVHRSLIPDGILAETPSLTHRFVSPGKLVTVCFEMRRSPTTNGFGLWERDL